MTEYDPALDQTLADFRNLFRELNNTDAAARLTIAVAQNRKSGFPKPDSVSDLLKLVTDIRRLRNAAKDFLDAPGNDFLADALQDIVNELTAEYP